MLVVVLTDKDLWALPLQCLWQSDGLDLMATPLRHALDNPIFDLAHTFNSDLPVLEQIHVNCDVQTNSRAIQPVLGSMLQWKFFFTLMLKNKVINPRVFINFWLFFPSNYLLAVDEPFQTGGWVTSRWSTIQFQPLAYVILSETARDDWIWLWKLCNCSKIES